MSGPSVKRIAPLPHDDPTIKADRSAREIPWGFLTVVVAPTVVCAIYYLFVASPIYVSESKFIVRSPERRESASLGLALQGVGLGGGQSDSFAVHEYVVSRDAVRDLLKSVPLRQVFGNKNADILVRYPNWQEARTNEGLHHALQRFVSVGYDGTTGISTLKVRAFSPRDAWVLNNALLSGGENLVNDLNERSTQDAVRNAERAVSDARTLATSAQNKLTSFRNSSGFIDPELPAKESSSLIVDILGALSRLKAEREQLATSAPQSPQIPELDLRIAAYERQISVERAKIAGNASSLAPQVGVYQDLVLERERADTLLNQATANLAIAQQDSYRKNLYLQRVVNPNMPDEPSLPRRWINILTVLFSSILAYGAGRLLWAAFKEHKQG